MTKCFVYPILFGTIMIFGRVAHSGEIEVSISPTEKEFALGAPVSCLFRLRNISGEQIKMPLEYPKYLGIAFKESEADNFPDIAYPQGRITQVILDPGSEYTAIIALNRFMPFVAGEHKVSYVVVQYQDLPSGTRELRAQGEIKVRISDRKIDNATIEKLCAHLQEKEPKKRRESVEMLLWVDDEAVVPYLIEAARVVPTASRDIIQSLSKFISKETGRKALFEVALHGNFYDLAPTFEICIKAEIDPPDTFLEAMLNSRDDGKRYGTLEYLYKKGTKDNLPQVRPLANDPVESIRVLAIKVLNKLND